MHFKSWVAEKRYSISLCNAQCTHSGIEDVLEQLLYQYTRILKPPKLSLKCGHKMFQYYNTDQVTMGVIQHVN